MMVASGATTCSGRHLRWLVTLALVLIMLGAVTVLGGCVPFASARGEHDKLYYGLCCAMRVPLWDRMAHEPVSPIVCLDTYHRLACGT